MSVFTLFLFSLALAEGLGLNQRVFEWVEKKYGVSARQRVESLDRLIQQNKSSPELEKITKVNDFFNKIPYILDENLWKERDYWATPIELLGIEGGDCEDYSIGKYFTLRDMGVAASKLRITYVRALTRKQAHMVLAYYPSENAEPLILDSLDKVIKKAGQRQDLLPVYSFNGESLWMAVNRSKGRKVASSGKVKLWNELRKKMEQELRDL